MDAFSLVFYVPTADAEQVKNACFAAGAGQIGAYSNCAWQVEGQGQFQPLPGSTPAVGAHNQISRLPETRVEMTLSSDVLQETLRALLQAHPYETPAYQLMPFHTQETIHVLIQN